MCLQVDPLAEAVAVQSKTCRQTIHLTVGEVHRSGSREEIDRSPKAVGPRSLDYQQSRTVRLRFEICRSERTGPSTQAAPARRKSADRRQGEPISRRSVEAGRQAP